MRRVISNDRSKFTVVQIGLKVVNLNIVTVKIKFIPTIKRACRAACKPQSNGYKLPSLHGLDIRCIIPHQA